MTDSDPDLSAVTALSDPTRRRVYVVVASSPEPMSRDQIAKALELPRSTAAFHLERLATEDLLETTHVRRSGKTGPGAGRPTKLYRRSNRQLNLTIPPRDYELAARLLAEAVEAAGKTGRPAEDELVDVSRRAGVELGSQDGGSGTITDTLVRNGFEPRVDGRDVVLGNCPFQSLATEFPNTICGMNLHLIRGLLDAIDEDSWSAELDPAPDLCCVRLQHASS